MTNKTWMITVLLALTICCMSSRVRAAVTVPEYINYQGRILDGTNLVNGPVELSFRIYKQATDGTSFFEDSNTVQVVDGLYSVRLGDNVTLGSLTNTMKMISALWLEVLVDGIPLTPRERIGSVVYALAAHTVEDGAITTDKIADGAVAAGHIQDDAVRTNHIAVGAVGSAQIQDDAVGEAQIAMNAVTSNQLAVGVVDAIHLVRDYQSGREVFEVPYAGLSTNITTTFSRTFSTTPIVTMNANPMGAIPSDFMINRLLLTSRSTTDFSVRAEIPAFSDGSYITPTEVASGYIGGGTSLALVDGYPAISYWSSTFFDLVYVRANDAAGTSWGPKGYADFSGPGASAAQTSLLVVGGRPAIAYYSGPADLQYVRANDATGGTWGTSIAVDTVGLVGSYASMAIVNGNPAISYYDDTADDLKYVRATDATGGTWGVTVRVHTNGNVGRYTSLAVVGGRPAISYYSDNSNDLKYVRADDASGNTWGTPVDVDTPGSVGSFGSMAIVNGRPAIAYYDATQDDLKYVRAADSTGSSWGAPLRVVTNGSVGVDNSLAVVDGKPVISYRDSTIGGLGFVQAVDVSGAAWNEPLIVDTNDFFVGFDTAVLEVNSVPGVAYQNNIEDRIYFASITNLMVALDWIAVEP